MLFLYSLISTYLSFPYTHHLLQHNSTFVIYTAIVPVFYTPLFCNTNSVLLDIYELICAYFNYYFHIVR